MEEVKQNEEVSSVVTQHKPHAHAVRRLFIGIGAVVLIVLGGIVWAKWGEEIKEACTGEEVCKVELPDTANFTNEFQE